jgi:hypothetical protein
MSNGPLANNADKRSFPGGRQLPDAPSDRWSLDQKEYFIIHSAVQILLNIHSFWPFPTCEFIGGEISL